VPDSVSEPNVKPSLLPCRPRLAGMSAYDAARRGARTPVMRRGWRVPTQSRKPVGSRGLDPSDPVGKNNRRRVLPRGNRTESLYERAGVKRGGAEFASRGSRTSSSPSASVDLAHLRPLRGRLSCAPRKTSSEPEAEGDCSTSVAAVYEALTDVT